MFVDRPVGIDLGTTNSEIALLDPSERDLVIWADRFGRRTMPSAVAWDAKAEAWLVGHPARARRGHTPPPIESIKRRMGQRSTVEVGPHSLLPEDVSAKILAELAERMHERLAAAAPAGIDVRSRRAVITVPAYFDAPQVEATRKAGEIAGLDVIGILQEPTAAAIYHTWKEKLGDGNFLVYDLGGGTFDVSILRCLGGEYQVLAIEGDNFLGGDDLDRRYAEHLRKDLTTRGWSLDLDVRGDEEDRRRFGRLVHLAQEIKESLSTNEVVHVSRQDVLVDKAGESMSVELDVGRDDYEKVVADLVETTLRCCERALEASAEKAGIGVGDIDHVVLVGGSTRVPLVVRRVSEAIVAKSRAKRMLMEEVDACVALGAAIHAAQIGGLGVGDPARKASVLVTSPLVTGGPSLRLGLRVDEAPDGARDVAVMRGGDVLAEAPFTIGSLLRLDVPLATEGETAVRLALRAGGEVLAEMPLSLFRGDVRPRASALSRASVVAKDIGVEVVRAGRRDRRIVVARGAGLPAEASHRFFTADRSGAVVLRLLQNRMPIRTLLLQVPEDLAVGTAVDVTIKVDEAMRIEARAVVAGRELWAQVEPPAPPRFDPAGAVEALIEQAEATSRELWGSLGDAYRREAEVLVTGVREVVATDPDKLQALCERLRLLVDEFRGGPNEALSPPWHRFETELDALRRLVYRTPGSLVGMDRDAWDARIGTIEERARGAYDAADAVGWRRAYNEVQALYETASQEEFAAMRLDDPAYLTRRVAAAVRFANRVELALADFVPSAADEVRALQIAERDRLTTALRDKVAKPLGALEVTEEVDAAALRKQIDTIWAECSRVEAALERIPALGLPAERG